LRRHPIFPFHYAPGEETVFFVATIRDQPGALASLLKSLGEHVNLLATSSYSLENDAAVISGYGKALSKRTTPISLKKVIEGCPMVSSCQVWKSEMGLIVDKYHTGYQGGVGEPYVVFPARGLSDTFEGVVRVFGTGGAVLLYELGLDYAKARSGLYKKMIGPHPESRIEELAAIVGALGYGRSTATFEPDYSALKLSSEECFECSSPSSSGRTCSFLRGMAVGIFGSLFNAELESEETKCRHLGDDFCEFTLKAKDGLPLVRSSLPS
jgi:predicted hydrocarbon binding protein